MILKPTFRKRATISIVAFAGLVALTMGLLGHVVNEAFERVIWHATLEAELTHYRDDQGRAPATAGPDTSHLSTYIRGPGVPRDRLPPAPLRELHPGLHDDFKLGGREFAVLVRDEGANRVYLVYDITDLETYERRLTVTAITGIALVGAMLSIVSYWLAGRLSEPIRDLARRVSRFDPAARGERVGRLFRDGEISTISKAIDGYIERVDGFVRREQEFTASASHELRTPAAVIGGAVDVLNSLPQMPERARPPLARIEQSVTDMEELINALLYLAREPDGQAQLTEVCRVDELLQTILADHGYLMKEKDIRVEILSTEPTSVAGPPMVARIVVSNLVRNAFEHTNKGRVELQLMGGVLKVENTAPLLHPVEMSESFRQRVCNRGSNKVSRGLGLQVIERLCTRAGWRLSIASEGGTTTATLDMRSPQATGARTSGQIG